MMKEDEISKGEDERQKFNNREIEMKSMSERVEARVRTQRKM